MNPSEDPNIAKYKGIMPTKRDVAVVGLRDDHGKVLMARARSLPEWWHPLGGGIEPSDTSPQAAVCREVKEELGIDLNPQKLQFVLTAPYDFGEGTMYFYETPFDRSTPITVDQNEIVELQWLAPEEALALPLLPGAITFFKRLAGLG